MAQCIVGCCRMAFVRGKPEGTKNIPKLTQEECSPSLGVPQSSSSNLQTPQRVAPACIFS